MFVDATILHADLDAFYASVEQRDHPWLRGRPVIVGSGVVLAASYEAKAAGIRTAMSGRQARLLCPQATVVPPRMDAYAAASAAVFAVFRATSPVVEPMSIDEAFLEVAGLLRIAGPPVDIAAALRADVRGQVGLAITVGIARTKFLAKVASGVAKPDGLLCVEPEAELAFLHPLPVERLWGVGQVTADKLRRRGVRTVGEVAQLDRHSLVAMLGAASGRHLHALAHNYDSRPVQTYRRRRSIGAQRALGRARRSAAEFEAALSGLVDRVTRRLRAAQRRCRTVVLRLRFEDYTRITRSHSLPCATTDTATIWAAARALLRTARPLVDERGLTLVGVALANLDDADQLQLELPFGAGSPDSSGGLDSAVDGIKNRFGTAAITRGALVGHGPDVTVPVLPDHWDDG